VRLFLFVWLAAQPTIKKGRDVAGAAFVFKR